MKNKSQNETGLRELLEDQLKDIYWAEKAITKAMPEMVEKVSIPGTCRCTYRTYGNYNPAGYTGWRMYLKL